MGTAVGVPAVPSRSKPPAPWALAPRLLSGGQRSPQPSSARVPLKHAAVCSAKVTPCLVWTRCKIVSKCQTRRVGLAVRARVRQPHSRPGSLGAPPWATGLQADGRRPSNRHRVSPEPTGASTRSLGALLGPTHPPPQCSHGHEGATSCPEPAPLMSGTSAQAPSPQTVRGVAPKREGRGRGGAPVRPPISCASLSSPPGSALRGWGRPLRPREPQAPVTPAPLSLQPTSARLQTHSPTSPRSTCTLTGRPWRASQSRPPLLTEVIRLLRERHVWTY